MQRTFGSKPPTPGGSSSNTDSTELAKREGVLEEKERQIAEKQKLVDDKLEQLEKIRKDLVSKLEKVSSMSRDEAQKILLENLDRELAGEISKKIKEAEEEIKLQADAKAKDI